MTLDPQQISSLCDRRKRSAATGVGMRRAETEGHQEVDREFGPGGVEDVGYRGSCSRSVKQQQTHMHKTRYIGTNIQKLHQMRD